MQTKLLSFCEIKDLFTTFLPLTQFSAVICKVLSFSQLLLTCAVFIQIELCNKAVSSIFPKMLVHFLMSSPGKFFCRKRLTFFGKDSFPWFCTYPGHYMYQFLTEPAFFPWLCTFQVSLRSPHTLTSRDPYSLVHFLNDYREM